MFPAQAPGCSIWSGPCVECGSSFSVLHKSADSVAPASCAFPGLSGSGSPRLGRPLPGCGTSFPSAASGPGSLRLGRTFPGCSQPFTSAASGSGSQRLGALCPGAARLFPPRLAAQAARGLAPSPQMRRTFSLRGPSAGRRSGLRKSLDRNQGPICSVGGGGFSGAEFAPFPLPPASYLQRGWAGSSLEFLSPFVLRTVGSVFRRLIFPCSPTV